MKRAYHILIPKEMIKGEQHVTELKNIIDT